MNTGKLIIISAPSGTGKSTIINRIIDDEQLRLEFSVSATTRPPREGETDGVNYYFISIDDFKDGIENDAFAEYQEVYEGRYYGTPKSEIARINAKGNNVILDLDVLGGINVKKIYGDHALAIFIAPPSLDALRERLVNRGTDSMEDIENRLAKADFEMQHAIYFDYQVVNDDLDVAVEQVRSLIKDFIDNTEKLL